MYIHIKKDFEFYSDISVESTNSILKPACIRIRFVDFTGVRKFFLANGRKMKMNCITSSNLPLSNKYKVIFVVQVLTYVILHIYSVLHYIVHMW